MENVVSRLRANWSVALTTGQLCLEAAPNTNAAKIWVFFSTLGFNKHCKRCAKSIWMSIQCVPKNWEQEREFTLVWNWEEEERGGFQAWETSGYSLTCFTSFSPGIHYSGQFWKFLLPTFLPFILLLPKMMQGLLLSFVTAFFIWEKSLCWCGEVFILFDSCYVRSLLIGKQWL